MQMNIEDLTVTVAEGKKILDHFSLALAPGSIHVIMGPNGCGKSTLSKVLLAHPHYNIVSGDIIVDGNSILPLSTDARSRLGIFLCYQNPISVDGVTNSEFLRTALTETTQERINVYTFMKAMEKGIEELSMDPAMMHRFINQDFSGGERKKNEILQMKMLKPKFVILDELDSGLDVDSLRIVCQNVNRYKEENPDTTILLITHYPRILEYIHPDYVHVMRDGKLVETGDLSLAQKIEKEGYLGTTSMCGEHHGE